MRMSILIFDGFTALDIVGGYESLSRIPGIEVEFVAKTPGVIAADTRALGLCAWKTLDEAAGTDILYVPGGPGGYPAQRDPEILDFIRKAHATTTWTIGICNGVEILATAGILNGVEVTTNYFARSRVAALGAKVLKTRYHRDGKIITGAGVSASADAGLFLLQQIVGDEMAETIQLGIEYYPDAPFGAKTVDEASDRAKAAITRFEERAEEFLAATPRRF
jgi:putative intracellular protease/amidase